MSRINLKEGIPAPKLPPEAPITKSRFGVISTVYHQQPGTPPTSIEHRFGRWLESDEQPYVRRMTAMEAWKPLDLGWIESCSLLTISNEEGKHLQMVPTEQQKKNTQVKVIELGIETLGTVEGFACVKPGEALPGFEPVNLKRLRIRCLNGPAKCNLSLFPD